MINIDWKSVLNQLLYDAHNPLLFNNGFFVYFWWRLFCVIIFSEKLQAPSSRSNVIFALFFYKASGAFVGIVILSAFLITEFPI